MPRTPDDERPTTDQPRPSPVPFAPLRTGCRTPIIDSHAHWYSDELLADLAQHSPALELDRMPNGARVVRLWGSVASLIPSSAWDEADRLKLMDELGIDLQVLSYGALDVGWAGNQATGVAHRVNDLLSQVCRAWPQRFRFLAVLPLDDRRAMLAELERALGLGAVGVGLTTTVAGRPLDAEVYRDFWHEASARKLVVAIHPCFPASGPAGDPGGFLLAGFPNETTLAASRLVLSGVLEECPDVRVIWSHLGGSLPMLVGRLDAGYHRFPTCPQPASVYLRRCYYDAVCSHGAALDCARETFGSGALLFGTDEPHRLDPPHIILETVRARPWPAEETEAVLGGNAERLFGLSGAAASASSGWR